MGAPPMPDAADLAGLSASDRQQRHFAALRQAKVEQEAKAKADQEAKFNAMTVEEREKVRAR